MGQLEEMQIFVRIVDAGGIGKAAEQMHLAKSAVSRRLTELEQRLGTQLLRRTTRKQSLTEAGHHYYGRAKHLLEDIELLDEQTRGQRTALAGTLKVSAPLSFGLLHLTDIIDEFTRNHPQLQLHMDFSDRHIDLVEEGYEMAIRIGHLADSSYQAKRLTTINLGFFASADYIKKEGEPKNIEQLNNHNFLGYQGQVAAGIELIDNQNQKYLFKPQEKMRANNGDFLKIMALKGHGIAHLPTFLCHQEIANGSLKPVLTNYKTPSLNAYAVYPKNRFLSQRCRTLIDLIAERIGPEPYWDK